MRLIVESGILWTVYTILYFQIKNWLLTFTINAKRIRISQKWSQNWTLGDVIVGDKREQFFIVIIERLIANDPVTSIEVADILEVCFGITQGKSLFLCNDTLLIVGRFGIICGGGLLLC